MATEMLIQKLQDQLPDTAVSFDKVIHFCEVLQLPSKVVLERLSVALTDSFLPLQTNSAIRPGTPNVHALPGSNNPPNSFSITNSNRVFKRAVTHDNSAGILTSRNWATGEHTGLFTTNVSNPPVGQQRTASHTDSLEFGFAHTNVNGRPVHLLDMEI